MLAFDPANKGRIKKVKLMSGVYKVVSSVGTSLDKSLDDFRNKKVFDFGWADPEKIELHDGAKSYFLTRSHNF